MHHKLNLSLCDQSNLQASPSPCPNIVVSPVQVVIVLICYRALRQLNKKRLSGLTKRTGIELPGIIHL
jgi:hypothetical protein